jgi:hypothetical protein
MQLYPPVAPLTLPQRPLLETFTVEDGAAGEGRVTVARVVAPRSGEDAAALSQVPNAELHPRPQ